ncbi:cell division protein FtsQ/DivIB [Lactobacillus sp. PV012]|uniref:cell division protein FtsQ/DivIB n=1 Tax=Lactobacillus sp. PV012 TaxID=2594494 RepID=UPI00223F9FB0|nr:cell division protein FtsQ/DivIB [Lactobacillus sp. PV012]QNQ82459.1 FtsQ-type POTRA domain-containing protein [Lactobacillus sp. PV012]
MAKKKITKKDPRKEISGWVDYKNKSNSTSGKKVSASLKKLHAERRKSVLRRLGLIIVVALIFILGLGYFISPLSNVKSVRVLGAQEINPHKIVTVSGIKAQDKVIGTIFKKSQIKQKLSQNFPEIKESSIQVKKWNNFIINVKQYAVAGYVKENVGYRALLVNGKLSTYTLPLAKIKKDKPIFINYSNGKRLQQALNIYKQFPQVIKNQVRVIDGDTKRTTQIKLILKDKNIILGSTPTIVDKIKYYPVIAKNLKQPSVVDFEIGAFSHPLTSSERKLVENTK